MKLKQFVLTLLSFCMCVGTASADVVSDSPEADSNSKVYQMSLKDFATWYRAQFWSQAMEFDCPIRVTIEDSFLEELARVHALEFTSRGKSAVLVSSEMGKDTFRAIANIHEICEGLDRFHPGKTRKIFIAGGEGSPIEFSADATRLTLRPVNPELEGNSRIQHIDFASIVDHHAIAMETLLRRSREFASEEEKDTRLVQIPSAKTGDTITN